MGTLELRKRLNWQTVSGGKALDQEVLFNDAFFKEFQNSETFILRPKPKEFEHIYEKVKLDKPVEKAVFSPGRTWHHGIKIDFAIENVNTSKKLYIEVKRQDGWVEGKPPSAGRGNAHERSCKFFTPGLLKLLKDHSNLGKDVLPFWIVYAGDIARDPKRVREITFWFDGFPNHFFMWMYPDEKSLVEHFNTKLKHLLL
ncbi:MAG: MunI family type II restriction endonuclease [bacterium]|nr:MunI family type II restriction endonuclease [bacterium]